MHLYKVLQGLAVLVLIASFQEASATSLRDWEGSLEVESEESMQKGQGVGEEVAPTLEETAVIVDVKAPELKRNEIKGPRKDLAMVSMPQSVARGIQDETAVTGENAKKKLPPCAHHPKEDHSHFMQEPITPHLLTVGTPHMPVEFGR
ncbi:MAG: hypothetical protein K2Y18_05090 [Alphaproteobacteria bacterium]|jgi:hypothetical protein|nr:hypothetical protein [Alphaproteobacteria bacterium]